MAEPSRPRPRPRPRPVVKQSSDGSSAPGSSSVLTSSGIQIVSEDGTRHIIEVKDSDDMFMRNRTRTAKTWQKLEEMSKEVSKPDRNASSDEDEDERRSPVKPKYKRKKGTHQMPLLERSREVSRMLSEALSDRSDNDDDDEEVTIIEGSTTPNGKRKRRPRSRSRSITPPPQLAEHQIERARDVVRKALQAPARAHSPTYLDPDESADTFALHSDLRAIAQEAKQNAARASSQAPVDAPEDHITVTVKWHPHPLDLNGKAAEWQYKLDRNDNFLELFEATAEDACIRSANLILTYQGKRFFSSVTPHTLHIWGDTAQLDGYEKAAYEYIQQHPPAAQVPTNPGLSLIVPRTNPATPPPETQESDGDSEAEGETLKLVLRSAGNKDIALTVRPTTKCGAILRAFLIKLGIAEQYPGVFAQAGAATAAKKKGGRKTKAAQVAEKDPRLCIDGDKMNNETEIGEMDLEDGDMVEVVDL